MEPSWTKDCRSPNPHDTLANEHHSCCRFESSTVNFEEYGLDSNGPVLDVDTDNYVVVPESILQLTEEQMELLCSEVNPFSDDGNYGINHFIQTLDIVNTFYVQLLN